MKVDDKTYWLFFPDNEVGIFLDGFFLPGNPLWVSQLTAQSTLPGDGRQMQYCHFITGLHFWDDVLKIW